MSGFVNSAPQFIPRGANDKSGKQFVKGETGNGYLVPKFFFWAKKGPEDLQFVTASDLKALYGEETFDRIKKWYNHQTLFMEAAAGTGANLMVKRLVPTDAGVKANVNVYIDILECEVSNYLRNSDGSIVVDEKGTKQLDPKNPKVKGYKLKFITESNKDNEPTQEGLLTSKAGTMTKKVVNYVDSETETEIIMVPSETETEWVDEIVPGEFVEVEEDHPTETVSKEVESGEYNITYVDSTTDFETKMVGTGRFEEKSVRDPENDHYVPHTFDKITDITGTDKLTSIKHIPTAEFLLRNKDKYPADLKVKAATKQDGKYHKDLGLLVYANVETLSKIAKRLRPIDVIGHFTNMDTTEYLKQFTKYKNYASPSIRLTNKLTGEVKYTDPQGLTTGAYYEFEIYSQTAQIHYPRWKKTDTGGWIVPATENFLDPNSKYDIEYIAIDTYISLPSITSLSKSPYGSYYTNTGTLYHSGYAIEFLQDYANAILKLYSSTDTEFKCIEDFEKISNPNNVINFRIEYTLYGQKQNIYFNTNDLTKFYAMEIDPALNTVVYKPIGGLEDLDITIPKREELAEDAETLFKTNKGFLIYPYETSVKVFKPTTGNNIGKWCLVYPSNITEIKPEAEKAIASLTVFDVLNLTTPIVLTNAEGFDAEFINYVKENLKALNVTELAGEVMEEAYKTIQEEILEPKKVPVQIEVKTPIMITIQVPKKVMVQKPKTIKVEKPKLVEKVVPAKVEVVTYERSTMYPVFEVKSKYHGEHYNNIGFSLNTNYGNRFDKIIANGTKLFPYGLSLYHRESLRHAAEITKTLSDENESVVVLTDASVRNPMTQAFVDFNNVFKSNWYNETSRLLPYKPFEIEYFKIYDNNLNKILKDILATEKEAISFIPKQYKDGVGTNFEWYDFTGDTKEDLDSQFGLLNIFTCKTSKNVNLQTAMISNERPELQPGQKEVNIGSNKPIFLENGSDGSLTDEEFERLVKRELDKYLDNNSEVQDMAVNKETLFVDSGFSLDVKKAILNFQTLRKDTVTLLSTHVSSLGKKYFNLEDTKAIGAVLNTAAKLAPESTFFGTNVARSMIIAGAGLLEDGSYDNYVPLTYELMVKICKFAGSPEGKWKYEYRFDSMPGNAITLVKDIQPATIPNGLKPLLWETNIVYPQNSDRGEYFFPGLQTVYDNETSVLNNPYAMLGLIVSTRAGFKTWVWFTGNSSLKENEFVEAVENYGTALLNDVFAGILKVQFKCVITEADAQRGTSWLNRISLYGNNGKTICQQDTEIYRMSDYK